MMQIQDGNLGGSCQLEAWSIRINEDGIKKVLPTTMNKMGSVCHHTSGVISCASLIHTFWLLLVVE